MSVPRMSAPRRDVIQAEALAWLAARPAEPRTSVVTSLPDVSELPELGFDGWREWFVGAARAVLRFVPDDGATIFFQSDIRYEGTWVDKGYLVQRAAELEGVPTRWHKIVCRKPPGTPTHGRASYSHLLCFSRAVPLAPERAYPDVLPDAGFMPWSKAMGVAACRLSCSYLAARTETRLVVDPFCGKGTVLAVANEFGLDALGVELSRKRCRHARSLALPSDAGQTDGAMVRPPLSALRQRPDGAQDALGHAPARRAELDVGVASVDERREVES